MALCFLWALTINRQTVKISTEVINNMSFHWEIHHYQPYKIKRLFPLDIWQTLTHTVAQRAIWKEANKNISLKFASTLQVGGKWSNHNLIRMHFFSSQWIGLLSVSVARLMILIKGSRLPNLSLRCSLKENKAVLFVCVLFTKADVHFQTSVLTMCLVNSI